MTLPRDEIREAVRRALAEDLGPGDVTSEALIPRAARGRAFIVCRAPGIVAGIGRRQRGLPAAPPERVLQAADRRRPARAPRRESRGDRRPGPHAAGGRADGAQFHPAAQRHRHADPPLRRGGRGPRREDPRHAQNHARPPRAGKIRRPRGRRDQSPDGAVRPGADQGQSPERAARRGARRQARRDPAGRAARARTRRKEYAHRGRGRVAADGRGRHRRRRRHHHARQHDAGPYARGRSARPRARKEVPRPPPDHRGERRRDAGPSRAHRRDRRGHDFARHADALRARRRTSRWTSPRRRTDGRHDDFRRGRRQRGGEGGGHGRRQSGRARDGADRGGPGAGRGDGVGESARGGRRGPRVRFAAWSSPAMAGGRRGLPATW